MTFRKAKPAHSNKKTMQARRLSRIRALAHGNVTDMQDLCFCSLHARVQLLNDGAAADGIRTRKEKGRDRVRGPSRALGFVLLK